MNKRFCPKCGATDKPFIKGFCKDCYLEDNELITVDKVIYIERCKRCNKLSLQGKWAEYTNENISSFIESKIKVNELNEVKIDFEYLPFNDKKIAKIIVIGEVDGSIISLEREALIDFKDVLCKACSRISARYYEAILQVRGNETDKTFNALKMKMDRMLSKMQREDSLAQVVELNEIKNGFDALIGSNRAARMIAESFAKEFNSKVVVSKRLHTTDKQGKRVYRFTYLVRVS